MQAGQAPPPALGDLPEAFLARVIGLAGPEAWPALALASRRLHDILYSPAVPEVWRSMEIRGYQLQGKSGDEREAWIAAKRHLLSRVGACLEHLAINDFKSRGLDTDTLDGLLALLPSNALRSLTLNYRDVRPSTLQALPRFSRLAALEWHGDHYHPGAELPAALGRLPQLHSVRLAANELAEGVLGAVLAMCSLTELDLSSAMKALPACGQLTALTALCRLRLREGRPYWWRRSGNSGGRPEPPLLLPVPSSFPAGLEHFAVDAPRDMQVGHILLSGSVECGRVDDGGYRVALSSLSLEDFSLTLAAILDAFVPASSPLTSLALPLMGVAPERLACGSRLGELRRLYLGGWGGSAAVHDTVLGALLPQAPRLHRLELEGCDLEEGLPPSLLSFASPCLEALRLSHCHLSSLTGGPYLRALTFLDLSDNRFSRVPPAVAEATALVELDMTYNPLLTVEIDAAWVREVACPRLQSLHVPPPPDHEAEARAAATETHELDQLLAELSGL